MSKYGMMVYYNASMTNVKNINKLMACKDLEIDMLGDFSSMSSIIT